MPNYILASTPQAKGGNLHCYHLPKGLLTIQLGKYLLDGETFYEFQVQPHVFPDPAHRYFIHYKKNIWASDRIDIQFNQKGFLSSISRKEAFKDGQASGQVQPSQPITSQQQLQNPLIFEATIDPFQDEQLEKLNAELTQIEPSLKLEMVYEHQETPAAPKDVSAPNNPPLYCGILCRIPTSLHIKLSYRDRIIHRIASLPHPDWVHLVEIPPQVSSSGHFQMEFDHWGYPTSVHIEKSSLWAKLADVPLTIAKKILEIPAQIFRIRIDTSTNQRALVDSQMALAEAQHQQTLASEALTAASKEAEEARKQADQQMEAEIQDLQSQLFDLIEDKNHLEATSIPVGRDMNNFDVKLQVLRYSSAKESTLGLLFDITKKRTFLAFTLEDEYRQEKKMHETRIPAGTYEIKLKKVGGFHNDYLGEYKSSFHKGMLHLQDVPGFTDILIHKGNYEKDTSGCLLVGNGATGNLSKNGKGMISSSGNAYVRIYPPIAEALEIGKSVGIEYVDYDSVG